MQISIISLTSLEVVPATIHADSSFLLPTWTTDRLVMRERTRHLCEF